MRSGFPSPLQVPGRENTRPRTSPADAKPLRYIPGGTSSAVPGFSARARGHAYARKRLKTRILDKIASYFVQSPTFPPCRSSKPFLGLAKWPYFKKGNTEALFVLPFNILKSEF